jgi:CheY-like chemotaxis protein
MTGKGRQGAPREALVANSLEKGLASSGWNNPNVADYPRSHAGYRMVLTRRSRNLEEVAVNTAPNAPARRPKKILLVDDSKTITSVLRAFLMGRGDEFIVASDADSALRCVLREQPDLIIADIEMPGMSGLDLCRVVRATPRLSSVRLIVISGGWTQSRHDEARRIGIDGWLPKPVNSGQLGSLVDKLLP